MPVPTLRLCAEPAPQPIARTPFDRWCWERGVDNVKAGERLGCLPETVRRLRLPFGHADRRVPKEAVLARIVQWTAGAITAADFYPPHLRPASPVAAELAADEDYTPRNFLEAPEAV